MKMKYQGTPQQPKRRKVLVSLIVGAVLLVALGFVAHHHLSSSKNSPDETAASDGQKIDYTPAKPSDNTPNNARKDNPTSSSSNSASTLNTPASPPPFSVTISRANPSSNPSGIGTAATINGATEAGICTFTASPHNGQGAAQTKVEKSILSNSSYICPGTTIPVSKGSWDVSVTVTTSAGAATAKWAANPVEL